jgi:hypothetical protein
MSNIEFFTYSEDALDIFEEDIGKRQKPGFVKFAKKVLKIVIGLGILFGIFYEFLLSLGTEKSQSIMYVNHANMTYNMSDIPRLLPVHHFSFFDTAKVINRMKCNYDLS